MSDFGDIIFNAGIAIEKLMAPAKDEKAGEEKGNHGETECDPQRRNTSLFNCRYHHENTRVHTKSLSKLPTDCLDASAGF